METSDHECKQEGSLKSLMHRSVKRPTCCDRGGLNSPASQSCMSTHPGQLRSRVWDPERCLQLVNICQTKYSTCEISRTVKTNRGASCDGGEGWEMYTLMDRYKHMEEERRKTSAQEREESGLYTCAHSHSHCKRVNDITVC